MNSVLCTVSDIGDTVEMKRAHIIVDLSLSLEERTTEKYKHINICNFTLAGYI